MGLLVKKDKDSCSQMVCGYSSIVLCNKMGSIQIDKPSQRNNMVGAKKYSGRKSEKAERTRKWRRAEGERENIFQV